MDVATLGGDVGGCGSDDQQSAEYVTALFARARGVAAGRGRPPQAAARRAGLVGVGPGRGVALSDDLVPRPAPPNRTCVSPRIRLSTSPCRRAMPVPASCSSMVSGSVFLGSDTG